MILQRNTIRQPLFQLFKFFCHRLSVSTSNLDWVTPNPKRLAIHAILVVLIVELTRTFPRFEAHYGPPFLLVR